MTNSRRIQSRRAHRHGQFAHSTLPGFKMPFGSSARFKLAHDLKFHGVGAAREFRGLEPADAVLGADAAAETLDQIEHRELERVRPAQETRQRRRRASGSS